MLSGVLRICGGGRRVNEDSLLLQQVRTRRGNVLLAAVCDGIGGLQEGEKASGYAVMALNRWFYTSFRELFQKRASTEQILLSFQKQIHQMQKYFQEYQQNTAIISGTTLTAFLLWEKRYLLVHGGDSRAYGVVDGRDFGRLSGFGTRRGRIRCLTWDDVDESGYLLRCLGAEGLDRFCYRSGRLPPKSGILLCTDGFYKRLSAEEMGEALCPSRIQNEEQLIRRLELLGEKARQKGSLDDMAAVYAIMGGKKS